MYTMLVNDIPIIIGTGCKIDEFLTNTHVLYYTEEIVYNNKYE